MPIASGSLTGCHWREPGSGLYAPSLQILTTLLKSPCAFSFPDWTATGLSSFPNREIVQSLCHMWPFIRFSPVCLRASCTEDPQTWTEHTGWGLPSAKQRGRVTFLAGSPFPDAAQDPISCPSGKDTVLACVWPRSCSAKHLFSRVSACIYWCLGLLPPGCRTFHFPLLNFMMFPSAHFSSLPRSLWMATEPSGVSATLPICVISKLAEGTLLRVCPFGYSSAYPEMIKEDERYRSPWNRIPWLTCNFVTALISSYPSPYYSSLEPDHGSSNGERNWVLFYYIIFFPILFL